jgi:hypothetical protein
MIFGFMATHRHPTITTKNVEIYDVSRVTFKAGVTNLTYL